MRYFMHLAYNGAAYNGWQIQPNAPSVQATLQDALTTILGAAIEITGCGRTDTGVHARDYVAHFDHEGDLPSRLVQRLNRFLPRDISIYRIAAVSAEAHARFGAYHRAYEYHIVLDKNPFESDTAWHYHRARDLDIDAMQAAAALLLAYKEFAPFCKTGHQAHTLICHLTRAEWEVRPDRLVFHIAANRFLRGMVRLIVGMCIQVGIGKLSLDEVRQALDTQTLLPQSYSVPPNGLFLCDIRYR